MYINKASRVYAYWLLNGVVEIKIKTKNYLWNLLLIKLSSAWHFQKKKGMKIQKWGEGKVFPSFVTF